MNENIETTSAEQAKGGMNTTMIIGAVIVLAIIGYFVITSTAKQPAENAAVTDTAVQDTTMEETDTSNAMMMQDTSTSGDTASDTSTGQTMEGDTVVVKMEAGGFYYTPNVIRVKKGQKVRVDMTSVGDSGMMMHDFTIDELDVSMEKVPEGESGTVEFVADTVGEFEYYCSVGEHRANGQIGTLIVEE
jgi:heme/copper-type cytochrome/quinol oxidase subunit 2